MIYRQKNKKKNIGLRIVIALAALLVILRLFNINVVDGTVKNAFNYVLESKSGVLSPLRNALVYFKSKSGLEEERKRLLDENTRLKLRDLTNTVVGEEFARYRLQFGEFATNTVAMKVILKPPFMPFDIIRLSGGLVDYAVGDVVFYENVAIGTITGKTDRYASAQLFSASGRTTPASIRGTQFEARGLGSGRYLVEAPKDFEVAEGDPVVYPYMQVVLLGVVGEIESNEEDLFKKVYFNIPIAVESLNFVTVGTHTYEQTQPAQ